MGSKTIQHQLIKACLKCRNRPPPPYHSHQKKRTASFLLVIPLPSFSATFQHLPMSSLSSPTLGYTWVLSASIHPNLITINHTWLYIYIHIYIYIVYRPTSHFASNLWVSPQFGSHHGTFTTSRSCSTSSFQALVLAACCSPGWQEISASASLIFHGESLSRYGPGFKGSNTGMK